MFYSLVMPTFTSDCVEVSATQTVCTYTQQDPLFVDSMTLVLGLSVVILMLAAWLIRYVFYR